MKQLIRQEIELTYDLTQFNSFEQFWEEVEAVNGYEEEWKRWKAKGVAAVYAAVYYEMKSELKLKK
jgi:hypothetical protein